MDDEIKIKPKLVVDYDCHYDLIFDFYNKNKSYYLASRKNKILSKLLKPEDRPEKIILGKVDNNKVCRFCGNTNQTEFEKKAHAIPMFLGNKILFSHYECDICNIYISKLETNFSDYIGEITKVAGRIKGYKRLKKVYTTEDERASFERKGSNNYEIRNYVDSDNEEEKYPFKKNMITFSEYTKPYTPIAVYKCLIKIFLTLLPEEELVIDNENIFSKTIKWIKEINHTQYNRSLILTHEDIYDSPSEDNIIHAKIYKRKEGLSVPYMVFNLRFNQVFLQINFIPETSKDDNITVMNVSGPDASMTDMSSAKKQKRIHGVILQFSERKK